MLFPPLQYPLTDGDLRSRQVDGPLEVAQWLVAAVQSTLVSITFPPGRSGS